MRFVPVKSAAQQDLQALHRVREQLLKSRTALVNQVRGLLGEHGIVAPRGIAHLRRLLGELLAEPAGRGLSGLLGETLAEIAERLRFFDQRVRNYDRRIERVFADDERCQRLAQVEGVGPLVATAIVSACWQCARVQKWPRTLGMAGTSAASALQRQSQCAAGDQQTRRSLSAHPADPRRSLSLVQGRSPQRPAQPVGEPA
jgi:transposase